MRLSERCGNGFGMIFVFTTIAVNFFLLGGQVEANYQLKLVDNRHGVSSVADGYRNMER